LIPSCDLRVVALRCDLRNCIDAEPVMCPVVHGESTLLLIKPDRVDVPVEHRQLHAPASGFLRDLRQTSEELQPDPASARSGPYEKILQIKAAPAGPGGEIEEVECETVRRVSTLCHYHVSDCPRSEQCVVHQLRRRHRGRRI